MQTIYLLNDGGLIVSAVQERVAQIGLSEPATLDKESNLLVSEGPLAVWKHLTVIPIEENIFQMEIKGLSEDVAEQIAEIYCEEFVNLTSDQFVSVDIAKSVVAYAADPLRPTPDAALAKTVMTEPTPPNLVKTVGTSAILAFAFACFGILLYTFIKDAKNASNKKDD